MNLDEVNGILEVGREDKSLELMIVLGEVQVVGWNIFSVGWIF